MNRGNGQFLDASGDSHVFPSMAGGATGTGLLVFMNSSRKAKSPPEVNLWVSEAEKKWSREMNQIREKWKELDDHQREYAQHWKAARKHRAEELQQFEEMCGRREKFILVSEADIDQPA